MAENLKRKVQKGCNTTPLTGRSVSENTAITYLIIYQSLI